MNLYHVNDLSVTVGINLLNFSRGYSFLFRSHSKTHATVTKSIYLYLELTLIGYEPADLTVHPPPKRSRVGSFYSHRCLEPPKFFPQRKSRFCWRYLH